MEEETGGYQMWKEKLAQALDIKLDCKVMAGFNANVDVVIKLDSKSIEAIIDKEPQVLINPPQNPTEVWPVKTSVEFVALLKECIMVGKSFYGVMDEELGDWFNQVFDHKEEAMGGQAGIIANQMAALQAETFIYTPVLSQKQAANFSAQVQYPVLKADGVIWTDINLAINDEWTKINYIFEYPKNCRFMFGDEEIVSPRANRVILGTRNAKAAMGFAETMQPHLSDLSSNLDVAFMAGYHHGKIEGRTTSLQEYIDLSASDLQAMKANNPDLKLHLEYVPMQNQEEEVVLLKSLAPIFTSFGINENEIRRLLGGLGYTNLVAEINQNERAFNLYHGALVLAQELQVPRVHVHNLGYYVVVLHKPYPVDPALVRQSCLFASAVNGVKALQGGAVLRADVDQMIEHSLSEIGLGQLRSFVAEAKENGLPVADEMVETGIMEADDHYCLIIPAHIIPNPVSTVGMGDTVSSSSYAAEISLAKNASKCVISKEL